MARRHRYTVGKADSGLRLDQFLAARAPLTRGAVRALIDQGAAYVGRRRLKRASYRVQAGEVVELYAPEPGAALAPIAPSLRVVYEDADLAVVDKPSGAAVQARREGEAGTVAWALRRRLFAAGVRRPHVWVVHRLDQPASGLLVVALSRPAAAALSRAFSEHRPARRYLAVVRGSPERDAAEIALPLAPGRHARIDPGGRAATTHVKVIARAGPVTLVEVTLETGRTHQIRAHLAAIGHPIVGDRRYGDRGPAPRLALHAAHLGFEHPRTGARLSFHSPLPDDLRDLLRPRHP
jgi:23S rRNA pseudouridine1911/1915/1917 synthase